MYTSNNGAKEIELLASFSMLRDFENSIIYQEKRSEARPALRVKKSN